MELHGKDGEEQVVVTTPVNGASAIALVIEKPVGAVSVSDLMTELPDDKLAKVAVIVPSLAIAESETLNCLVAAKPGNANTANNISVTKEANFRKPFI
jgi:hypothetical protein